MELILIRQELTDTATIGTLLVNGVKECYVLEDKDRGIHSDWDLSKILATKVHGKTAIPYGKYKVVMSFSNRFQKYLPEIVNVPGWTGVRIHPGNKSEDTEGCLLPGQTKALNFVGNSVKAFGPLSTKIQLAEKKEKIWLTIKKG